MAAPDDTALKALIDSNIPDATPGAPRKGSALFVRTVLKTLVDWVKTAINTNLSTWLKVGTGQPSGSATETVYRTGKTVFGRTTDDGANATVLVDGGRLRTRAGVTAITSQTVPNGMAALPFGTYEALQIQGGANGFPAFLEFHIPGLRIDQLGMDTDGQIVLHPWATNQVYALVFSGYSSVIGTNNNLTNKKLVLFDSFGNNHQFMGFGVNSGLMRYQVAAEGNDHVFYAATSPTTSVELFRIRGNGTVGIGITPNPKNGLELGKGWLSVVSNNGGQTPGSGQGVSLGWNYSAGGGESNLVWGTGTIPTAWLGFASWNGTTYTEWMRLTHAGNLCFGLSGNGAPGTARIHINGPTGHQQLRLEQPYTPTGSGDANGAAGSICWDSNYMYVKTAAGWKRSALTTF